MGKQHARKTRFHQTRSAQDQSFRRRSRSRPVPQCQARTSWCQRQECQRRYHQNRKGVAGNQGSHRAPLPEQKPHRLREARCERHDRKAVGGYKRDRKKTKLEGRSGNISYDEVEKIARWMEDEKKSMSKTS